MLEPTTRHLFTDAVRPPTGFTLDVAVGTTYTLNLHTLLLPPLAMAAHDTAATHDTAAASGEPTEEMVGTGNPPGAESEQHTTTDTLALLEAVRRFADRMTVFCHAGAIHPPGRYRSLLTFAEDSLIQALPENPGYTFHPKMWALRFRSDDRIHHRLLVLSRNLTEDKSWDTILVLDEDQTGRGIDAAPAATFLRALPDLAVGPLPAHRHEQVEDLASTIGAAGFEVPAPFTRGTLLPLGVGADGAWPVPDRVRRAVVISPFLDATTVGRVNSAEAPVFVSRPVMYNELGAATFHNAALRVLDPHAERELTETDEQTPARPGEVRSGLHAKVLLWDYDRNGHLLTGSANATRAAFGGNVEFSVQLTGPQHRCGVRTLLPPGEPSRDAIAFGHILQPHTIDHAEPQIDPARSVENAVQDFHADLVRAGPRLQVQAEDDDESRFSVHLTFKDAPPGVPGRTLVRVISRATSDRRAFDAAQWSGLGMTDLTPYVEVHTTADVPGADKPVQIAAVLKAEMIGAPPDRAGAVLRSFLDSEDAMVRYLRFLLDEGGAAFTFDDVIAAHAADDELRAGPRRARFEDLALLEPLLRAAAGGSEVLSRVDGLLRDLGVDRNDPGGLPDDFLHIWDAIWRATTQGRDVNSGQRDD